MKLDEFRLCVRPGHGLVARFAASVLVVTASDWAGLPAVDRLLEECRRPDAGRPLADRLAGLIDDVGAQKVPAFCAVAEEGDGLALFVHGDSQVMITGAQPVMRLSGRGSAGWSSGIHDRVASLVIAPAGGPTDAAPSDIHVDLRDGVVPGSAIVLLARDQMMMPALDVNQPHGYPDGPRAAPPADPADMVTPPWAEPVPAAAMAPSTLPPPASPAPPPPSAPAMPPPTPGIPPPAVAMPPPTPGPAVTPATAPPPLAPAPVAAPPLTPPPSAPTAVAPAFAPPPSSSPPAAAWPSPVTPVAVATPSDPVPAAAVDGAPAMVWGIHCKRGHFNNPDARYCRMCGTHMVHQRKDPVLGPRPVLGFLVVDDGSTFKLDADYVVGREPDSDAKVRAGEARGLSLADPEDTVSAVHAAIRLDKWDVFITDLMSRFGTHVWKPGTDGWVRLEPGQTVMLEPRTHLLFGRRTVVYDSVNRR